MSAPTPSEMVTLLETALGSGSVMALSVRLPDGETITYRSRMEVIKELEYWRSRVSAETGDRSVLMRGITRGQD